MITPLIKEYVSRYPRMKPTAARWQEPLVAVASAKDPKFLTLKEAVSPSHALPEDLLPEARSVIAYFLPFKDEVNKSNIPGREASRLWAETYIATNQLIADLNGHLKDVLEARGYSCALIPATHKFDGEKLISDWSHRHVAHIAGLGGFGMNNMLITAKGCCGRIGSLVTSLELPPSPEASREYCLAKHDGSCLKCLDRCVQGALGEDSFDRWKCYAMCLHNDRRFPDLGLTDVCGKCLVRLPCSTTDPVIRKL